MEEEEGQFRILK